MIALFMLAMSFIAWFIFRLARKSGPRRDPYKRRPGRADGVRTVYKRHQ